MTECLPTKKGQAFQPDLNGGETIVQTFYGAGSIQLVLSPRSACVALALPSLINTPSEINTPNTWGIYIINLVCQWLKEHGGLEAMEKKNEEKARVLYDAIDSSYGYYRGHADNGARSLMNVTFRLLSEELEKQFAAEATAQGLDGLKGHRSVGGVRASIYNAFPLTGVEALVGFMKEFSQKNNNA